MIAYIDTKQLTKLIMKIQFCIFFVHFLKDSFNLAHIRLTVNQILIETLKVENPHALECHDANTNEIVLFCHTSMQDDACVVLILWQSL